MIAEQIAAYICEKGIKQKALADAIGIAPQSMSEMLRGNRTLTAEEYVDICDFLNVPYGTFVN